jgi:hypothetical protein
VKTFNRLQTELDFIDTATLADTGYLRISARTLGLLNLPEFCPGCFWLRLQVGDRFPFQIPMPGVFNTIDGFSKRVVHAIIDAGCTWPGWLPSFGHIITYTQGLHASWFYCKDRGTRIMLTGTPDDVFLIAGGSYHITDYKTAVFTDRQNELLPLYDAQVNGYAYIAARLLERDPLHPISGISLVFFEPQGKTLAGCIYADGPRMRFTITCKPLELRCDELIPPLLARAREIFEMKRPPAHVTGCKEQALLTNLLKLLV